MSARANQANQLKSSAFYWNKAVAKTATALLYPKRQREKF